MRSRAILAQVIRGWKPRLRGIPRPVAGTVIKARVTGFIGRLALYGVFAITAAAAGTIDVGELARLQGYLLLHSSLALLFGLWILPGLIALLTPLRYWDVLRAFRGPLVTAFATANLLIVLPVLAADGKRLLAPGMHIIALALIGSYTMQGRLRVNPKRLLGFAAITLVLLAVILGGIRACYTYVFVAPFTADKVLTGCPGYDPEF
jgi:hypothetical protein